MWFEDSIGSDDESHGLLVSCFPIMQTCVLTVDFPEGVLARYKVQGHEGTGTNHCTSSRNGAL